MNFPPSYKPGTGDPGHDVPPPGNEGTLWSYLGIIVISRGRFVFVLRLVIISLTYIRPQTIIHNKTLAASAYSYIIQLPQLLKLERRWL